MSLLPSKPEASPSEDAGPRVIGVDSEDADEVLSALSSETARRLLTEVHDEPAPPSDLADRVETSLQNAQYHLEKLENAGAVEVVDTAYSAKGREMDVYAAADQPLVIFAGDREEGSLLRTALGRLLGALGVLALASLAVQAVFGRLGFLGSAPAAGGDGSGAAGGDGGGVSGGGDGSGGDDGGAGGDGDDAGVQDVLDASPTPEPEATGAGTPTEPGQLETPDAEATPTDVPEALETVTETATGASDRALETAADASGQAAGGLPPGLVFFAGGAFVLAVVALAWYWRG